jgi:hypothetical protein
VPASRHFLSDPGRWIGSHWLAVALAIVVVAAAGAGAYLALSEDSSEPAMLSGSPAPTVVIEQAPEPEQATELGFPAFATKNTTRIAGADPAADAAGAALAAYPSTGGVAGPSAVTLVDAADWQAGIAAASLVASPVGAPILVGDGGELPSLTETAIRALAPAGSPDTGGRQVFALGAAPRPPGFDAERISGGDPAKLAAEVDELRTKLAGEPDAVLVVSSEEAPLAMPAAAWAARSGDPVLFAGSGPLPEATAVALHRHERSPVYVLGGESAISERAFEQIERISPGAQRIGDDDPVASAVEFARYASGDFGWNINDPGHGFVIANAERPLDAAAAAPLSASGTWGPLLVTDERGAPPGALRGYLLDLKPGYESDPTRAVYNHVWLIGDTAAISVDFQSQVDEFAEVAPVSSGTGGAAQSQSPEDEAQK